MRTRAHYDDIEEVFIVQRREVGGDWYQLRFFRGMKFRVYTSASTAKGIVTTCRNSANRPNYSGPRYEFRIVRSGPLNWETHDE